MPTAVRWTMHVDPTSSGEAGDDPEARQLGCLASMKMIAIALAVNQAVTERRRQLFRSRCQNLGLSSFAKDLFDNRCNTTDWCIVKSSVETVAYWLSVPANPAAAQS